MKCTRCGRTLEEHSPRNQACPIYGRTGNRVAYSVGWRYTAPAAEEKKDAN